MTMPKSADRLSGRTEGDLALMDIFDAGTTTAATPLLLTVEEAAQRLGIGRTTVFGLIKSGELESVPLGRLRRIPTECINEYIDRLRIKARADRHAA
ncbi:helix-turn-helix domain-containing protein [Kribbella monticola]|uniref:helix-turn-helix domain-containing protein n=1 Tax=Kribbella monticola TaxID=2185285 RepID=UPI001E4F343C|nr:helix-turn-helix domain-containing protein [Kribbella monticola]